MKLAISTLVNLLPFAYGLACWFQLGVCGTPAAWNLLGRLLLAIV